MGTLTVYFVGLCTHLTGGSSGVAEHRVVLVNASRDRLVNGRLVQSHTAQLHVPGEEEPIPLTGAHVRVNAESSLVEYEPSWRACLPRLSDYSRETLSALSAPMATWENADLVSAYFDASGRFSAGKNKKGAAVAVLNVKTIGNPVVRVQFFDGTETEPHHLEDGAAIVIENVDAAPHTDDNDFLLHYKILMRVPADADYPRHPGACTEIDVPLSDPLDTVGPGCSNSTYP